MPQQGGAGWPTATSPRWQSQKWVLLLGGRISAGPLNQGRLEARVQGMLKKTPGDGQEAQAAGDGAKVCS